jgi:hypothetical protein
MEADRQGLRTCANYPIDREILYVYTTYYLTKAAMSKLQVNKLLVEQRLGNSMCMTKICTQIHNGFYCFV